MYIGDIGKAPCLHWILPLGTHTHITYGSCVPITQHKAKTHKQTKTRTHALTLAEAKASILFVYVTLVLFYHY